MEIVVTLRGGDTADGLQNLIQRRVDFALKKFKFDIQRIHIRFEGLNDLKGEVGVQCMILFNFFSRGMVIVKGSGLDVFSAFNSCIKKIAEVLKLKNENAGIV